ncbi:MAG: O-antigen ligase family protein [Magnetococcales bacterium]|nr:O-antigen ligase family protein [Magnetococcales bacterium]
MRILVILVFGVSAALLATPHFYLAPLVPLGVLGFFLLLRQPEFGYHAIVFLIPFGAYRKLGGLNLPWLIAGALVLILALRLLLRVGPPLRLASNLWLPLALLGLVSIASAYFSPFPETAHENVFLLLAAALFVLFGLAFIDRRGFEEILPRVLIWSITLGSLLAVSGFFFHIDLFAPPSGTEGDIVRGKGGSLDANNMSLMILFVLPLLVHRLLWQGRPGGRLLTVGLILINLTALLTTYSRSGLLVAGWTVLLLVVENRQRIDLRRGLFGLLGLLILPLLVLPLMPESFWSRHASLGEWEDTSLQRRTSYLSAAWDAFREHPVLGVGPGTFRKFYAETEQARAHERTDKSLERYAHNTYLEFLVGTGVLGLVLFLSLLLRAWRNFTLARAEFRERGAEKLASLAGHYRVSLLSILTFLVVFSEPYHKYLLVALPLSQVALWLAERKIPDAGTEVVRGVAAGPPLPAGAHVV